jgi:hypothetical protein
MSKKLNAKLAPKEHKLEPYEYNYLRGLAHARNQAYNQWQSTISTFLAYLAGSKWGYKDVELDFEFDEDKQTVTVKEHDEGTDFRRVKS